MKIQCPEACDLFHLMQTATEPNLRRFALTQFPLFLPELPIAPETRRTAVQADALHDRFVVVALAQTCHADGFLAADGADREIFPPFVQLHDIALGAHDGVEISRRPGDGSGLVDGLPHEIAAGGLAVFLRKVDAPRRSAAGRADNGQSVLLAQLV